MVRSQLLYQIKFIESCRKDHICDACKKTIKKKDSYFTFSMIIKTTDGQTFPADPKWPEKICYTCYPKQRLIFRGREDDVLQMQLGI